MKLFVWWRLESRNELFLSQYGFQRMTIVQFDNVTCGISGALILAFRHEIFTLLDAGISHGLLGLHPIVTLNLCFETLDIPVSLPTLDLFREVLDHAARAGIRRLFRSNISVGKRWFHRYYESTVSGLQLFRSFSTGHSFGAYLVERQICFRRLRFHS